MGAAVEAQQQTDGLQIDDLLINLNRYATDWAHITLCLDKALATVDKQKYRAARPLNQDEPLNVGIDPSADALPATATLIAIDGSQAAPSRHAPHLYYLINTGTIVYHHGSGRAPEIITSPELFYMGDGVVTSEQAFLANNISIQRDMAEIGGLARTVWQQKYANAPIVAVLDQRLQYFPIGANMAGESDQYMQQWIEGMETIKACNGLLVGYIERPETSAIVTLLHTLNWGQADFDPISLNQRSALKDVSLYRKLLQPGQRSNVFEVVNQSTNYQPFVEANQEICFFYFKPTGSGDVTRVDVPKWAAQQPEVIAQIHALLHDQCRLLGGYPYILTRADEAAVVQGADRTYLAHLIDLEMQRRDIVSQTTVKQLGKDLSHAGKRQHNM